MTTILKHESERTEAECHRWAEAEGLREEALDAEVKRLLTPDGIHELMQDYELWADGGFQMALSALCVQECYFDYVVRVLKERIKKFICSKAKVPTVEEFYQQLEGGG